MADTPLCALEAVRPRNGEIPLHNPTVPTVAAHSDNTCPALSHTHRHPHRVHHGGHAVPASLPPSLVLPLDSQASSWTGRA